MSMSGTKQASSGTGGLFPNTPNIKKEPPKGQVHEARVTGVDSRTFDSGSKAIEIALESTNTNRDYKYLLFLPNFFTSNPQVDPTTLSEEKPTKVRVNADGEEEEYEGQSEQQQYATRIRNQDGSGELEQLFSVAEAQGRTEGTDLSFTDFDSLVEVLSKTLPGTEFIMTLKADTNPKDPAFADQLRVRSLISPTETKGKLSGTATRDNPKRFSGLKRMWD